MKRTTHENINHALYNNFVSSFLLLPAVWLYHCTQASRPLQSWVDADTRSVISTRLHCKAMYFVVTRELTRLLLVVVHITSSWVPSSDSTDAGRLTVGPLPQVTLLPCSRIQPTLTWLLSHKNIKSTTFWTKLNLAKGKYLSGRFRFVQCLLFVRITS